VTDKEKQKLMDYKNTFLPPAGIRVLDDLKRMANFHNSIVARDNAGKLDPFDMIRREGQRSVIIHIVRQMEKVPKE